MADLFHDVDVVERTQITREGEVEKVYRVSAHTASGVYFRVELPEKEFTKETVAKRLAQKAQQIEAIKAL